MKRFGYYLVAGENNAKHNYRSVTLDLFHVTGSEIPLICINSLFSTNLRLLLGISFAHLARLLATFCIFHILERSFQIPMALDLSLEPHLATA